MLKNQFQLRESLKKMGLEKITSGRKLTPNLVRKSIWTISEQTINLQREMVRKNNNYFT